MSHLGGLGDINHSFAGSSDCMAGNLNSDFVLNGFQMLKWVSENDRNSIIIHKPLQRIYYVPSTLLTVFRLFSSFTNLQIPHDVYNIINSFTDEKIEVKRDLLILLKVIELSGYCESKPRKFTHINTTKLHWTLKRCFKTPYIFFKRKVTRLEGW